MNTKKLIKDNSGNAEIALIVIVMILFIIFASVFIPTGIECTSVPLMDEIESTEYAHAIYKNLCTYSDNIVYSEELDEKVKEAEAKIEFTLDKSKIIDDLKNIGLNEQEKYYPSNNEENSKALNVRVGEVGNAIVIFGENEYIYLGKIANKQDLEKEFPYIVNEYKNIMEKGKDEYEIDGFKIKTYNSNSEEQAVIIDGDITKFISTSYIDITTDELLFGGVENIGYRELVLMAIDFIPSIIIGLAIS